MKLLKWYILTMILLFLTYPLMAQPELLGAPTQAPIDGGLSFLAAAGGLYAWKKLRNLDSPNE